VCSPFSGLGVTGTLISLLRSKFFDEYEIVVYNSFDGFPVVIEPPYVL